MKGEGDSFVVAEALFSVVLAFVGTLLCGGLAGFAFVLEGIEAEAGHYKSLLLGLELAQDLLANVPIAERLKVFIMVIKAHLKQPLNLHTSNLSSQISPYIQPLVTEHFFLSNDTLQEW